ncbi:hypothetical protein RGR602_PC00568 (plasmid) [Rhizobium gallicum bv. gallicum R602sp]|uniref:Uncharacterized protein n=1 Tax=Rhizobium gallicum bv. gallicum R602sp TaxID=1041138 RepID=A0A0B4XDC3_9HYPH|nr:hypothetical protein RGR602_PC00568 [Rhizobium gallicum bv. gallicum R602sp]
MSVSLAFGNRTCGGRQFRSALISANGSTVSPALTRPSRLLVSSLSGTIWCVGSSRLTEIEPSRHYGSRFVIARRITLGESMPPLSSRRIADRQHHRLRRPRSRHHPPAHDLTARLAETTPAGMRPCCSIWCLQDRTAVPISIAGA